MEVTRKIAGAPLFEPEFYVAKNPLPWNLDDYVDGLSMNAEATGMEAEVESVVDTERLKRLEPLSKDDVAPTKPVFKLYYVDADGRRTAVNADQAIKLGLIASKNDFLLIRRIALEARRHLKHCFASQGFQLKRCNFRIGKEEQMFKIIAPLSLDDCELYLFDINQPINNADYTE